MLSKLRPSVYGANLRVPQDRLPLLAGTNNWTGTNRFADLYVDSLHVTQLVEFLGSAFASYISGQGDIGTFGTAGPQDFGLTTNSVIRECITSAGAVLFASAAPSSVFTTVLDSDFFPQGDENPATGWTQANGFVSSIQVSAQHAVGQGNNIVAHAYHTTSPWALSAMDAQAVLFASSTAGVSRVGVYVFMASSSPAGYGLVRQGTAVDLYRRTAAQLSSEGTSQGTVASVTSNVATTARLFASAHAGGVTISSFIDGVHVNSFTDASPVSRVGFAGVLARSTVGAASGSGIYADDFQVTTTTGPPFAAEDIVVQASAAFWEMLGQATAKKWLQVYDGETQLGLGQPVVFAGLTSAFVSAGTSAYFNTATYGVVRLASAVGTTGLSGVVGFSATGGLTISAVGNDLAFSPQPSASAAWFYPGTVSAPGLAVIGDADAGFFQPSAGTLAAALSGAAIWNANFSTSGNFLGVGTASAQVSGTTFTVVDASAMSNSRGISHMHYSDATTGGTINLRKARGTEAVPSAVLSGDVVGNFLAAGWDTTTFRTGGRIRWIADENWTSATTALHMEFSTVSAGGTGLLETMRLTEGKMGVRNTTPTETLHVGGTFQLSAVASGNLPAASATRDGMLIVDLTASGLVIYANGKRLSAAFAAFT